MDNNLSIPESYPNASYSQHFENCHFDTKAVHSGQQPDPNTGAILPPIFMSSTYARDSPYTHKGYDYTRAGNPNFQAVEQQVAALEGGQYATVFSSGLSAIASIISSVHQGESVVAFASCYGGTYRILTKEFQNWGIKPIFAKVGDWEGLKEIMSQNTPKIFIFESPTNPLMEVIDIEKASSIAKQYGCLTIVDNTFASPYFQKPLELGADAVVHSSTKYLGGHSDIIGGIVVTNNPKIHSQCEFHRLSLGLNPSPFDCWLISRSIKTLHLRSERHGSNAMAFATYLSTHPHVTKVYYPGLESHPDHELAKKQMKNGFGGMLSAEFNIKTLDQVLKFMANFKVFTMAESLGGVESLIDHPATMTHASIPLEERMKVGITDSVVRFSVGIENIEDLIKDFENAFSTISVNGFV